jgi:hypothetical protein
MKLSCQFHDLAALFTGKFASVPIGRDLCAPQNTFDMAVKMNNMCLGQESKPIPRPNHYNDHTELFNVCKL